MSGIVGIFNLDGRPAERALLERMRARIGYRGSDHAVAWARGPVALAHALLRTTPGPQPEGQSFPEQGERPGAVLHGRIDNREAVAADLSAPAGITDIELLLRAYERWGTECARRIIGDFALAIWDPGRRQLFCARDPFGHKPFFYARPPGTLLFASELSAILEDPRVPKTPDEEVVAEYLASDVRGLDTTLFAAVRRLPPAHALLATSEGMRIWRFWDFDPALRIRYRDDREYAEHFMAVFRTAVSSCLRTAGPAGAFLSGGLDSSSVACVAQAASPGLETFSVLFPGKLCDETGYVEDVIAKSGVTANRIVARRFDPFEFYGSAADSLDFPGYPNGDFLLGPVEQLAQVKGIRVLLTGQGGDEALTGSLLRYADLLRGFRWLALATQMKIDRSWLQGDPRLLPMTLPEQAFLRLAVFPLIPFGAKAAVKRLLGRKYRPPAWLGEALLARTSLTDPERTRPPARRFSSIGQQRRAEILASGVRVHEVEMMERAAARFQVELRSPFMDRRVLEFALALPAEQLWRGDHTKFVLRESLQEVLPESVRLRRSKADFSDLVVEAVLDLNRAGFFASMESARRGWVVEEKLQRAVRDLAGAYHAGGTAYLDQFWPLWMAAGIEFWTRRIPR